MDISALKQQARALEQQGSAGEALAVYRQILSELDAIGAIRQELPLLIKIGDLQLKAGDVDGAVDMYERAAGEYAAQGAAQPVMSLCGKIVRADPQAVGAYLRLARRLLDNGHIPGARDVLMDYAERAKLDKTREGLERLAGHAEDDVKRILSKAIDSAEERAPKRTPWAQRPAPASAAPAEEDEPPAQDELSPPPKPPTSRKRLTVPVGALDAEPEPSLLEQRPPEPRPEVTPESLFPTAADLQAPVIPETPAAPSPAAAPPVPPPLPPPGSVEPPKIETVAPLPETPLPPPPPPPPPPPAPPLRASSEVVIEPSFAPPPPTAEPRPEEPITGRPSRPSRRQPRPSHVAVAAARRPAHPAPRWLRPMVGGIVVVGGVGALLWFRVIPVDRLRSMLPQRQTEEAEVQPEVRRPVEPRPDTVMARDTATAEPAVAAAPAPSAAARQRALPPPAPPTLPPGVVLSGTVYVVLGLPVESLIEISPENRLGFRIAQVLDSGQRIILEEFPADTTVEGEIGVTGLPGDTVVAHVRMGGVDITLKGVIPEALAVDLLQRLVQVRP